MSTPHRLDPDQYAGYRLYSLTICTCHRAHRFTNQLVVELVQSQILRTATKEGYEVLAYCFMPDHVHLVVAGMREEVDLRRFVSASKQASGFEYARARRSRLWQANFFDRTIRRSDDLRAIIAYMLNNPVRKGLVDDLRHYPYWGSQIYTREQLLEFVGTARRRP